MFSETLFSPCNDRDPEDSPTRHRVATADGNDDRTEQNARLADDIYNYHHKITNFNQ